MATFYQPPGPFLGGRQPYERKLTVPIPPDSPLGGYPKQLAIVTSIVATWGAVFVPQPVQARPLNPALLAPTVTADQPAGVRVPCIVELPDAQPILPRKLSPALLAPAAVVDNPPPRRAYLVIPPPEEFRLPQANSKLVQATVAVTADQPPGTTSPHIVELPDPQPVQARPYSAPFQVTVVTSQPFVPPWLSAVLASWRVQDVAPQAPATKINPALISNDTPPISDVARLAAQSAVVRGAWEVVPPLPTLAGKLNPYITSNDNPPFGQVRPSVFSQWQATDPPPTLADKLLPTILNNPPPDNPSFGQKRLSIFSQWQATDPSPVQATKPNPRLLDSVVPPHSLAGLGVVDAAWRTVVPPLPQVTTKLLPATPVVVDNPPPFRAQQPYYADGPPLPTLAGKLNPSILNNPPVVDQPPGSVSPRIWVLDDPPLPQVGAKLAQGTPVVVDNPPFSDTGRTAPQTAVTRSAWEPFVPLPTLAGKLNPTTLNNPPVVDQPPGTATPKIVTFDDPPLPTLGGKLPPSITNNPPAVAGDQPPGSASLRIVSIDDPPLPTLRGKLNPSVLNIPVVVDNPPFGLRRYIGWSYGDLTITTSGAGDLISSVDNPPFGAFAATANVVLVSWRAPDPLPTLRGKLNPTVLDNPPAPQAHDQPPGAAGPRIVAFDDPPQPTLAGKLNPSILNNPAVVAAQPPGSASPRIVTVDDPPQPQTSRHLPASVTDNPPVVDNPPFRHPARTAGQTSVVRTAWNPPDPLPTLAGKLPPVVTNNPPQNPPFSHPGRLPNAVTVLVSWRAPDPQPKQANKLPPVITNNPPQDPPFLHRGRTPAQGAIARVAWTPPDPQPTLSGKLPPSITNNPPQDPPFNSRRDLYYVLAWIAPDPLPQLGRVPLSQEGPPTPVVGNSEWLIRARRRGRR